jgi:hypothetical protein
MISIAKKEHSREENFTFEMSQEILPIFLEELCKEETKETLQLLIQI